MPYSAVSQQEVRKTARDITEYVGMALNEVILQPKFKVRSLLFLYRYSSVSE